jgi:hypothetical protein
MNSGRLIFFLIFTLAFPTRQVVVPQRDVNVEEAIAGKFEEARREARLPELRRLEGSAFSRAACEAAEHGNPDKVWVENAGYAAVIYSTSHPEDAAHLMSLAMRAWKPDQRLVTGACFAQPPAFSSGRYWVAIGVVGGVSERTVADLLAGRAPVKRAATSQAVGGE